MATAKLVKDISPHEFVKAYSTDIVKTGRFKELAPYDPDWYYIRTRSWCWCLQRIYGGNKRNGSCPPHFCKSSGAVARHILHGRRITSTGQRDLDQIAGQIVVAP
ncbi:hypothetical protein CsSME_00021424 [Camellia sinensis var. sinensis]